MRRLRILASRALAAAFWICAPAALVVLPAAARAQVPDHDMVLKMQREQRQGLYKQMQAQVASMPVLPAGEIAEVFQLKMEGNSLKLSSPLIEPGHSIGNFRVASDSLKGPTYASVQPIGAARAFQGIRPVGPAVNGGVGKNFSFVNYELPDPDALVTISVQSFGANLQISRVTRSGANGYRMVNLIQQRTADGLAGAAPGQSPMQLSVTEFGDNGQGNASRNFAVQSPDFQALLREHVPEVDQYVRPLLQQLGQESALAPDRRVAWQVLADHWLPDPELTRKARQLLPALDDVDFHARDKALAELEAMGMPGATVLIHLDRSRLSPEQNLMIDRTLAPFAQLAPRDANRLRGDTEFLLDCLYITDRDVRAAALDRLRQVTGKDLLFDLDLSEPQRPAAISALRKQVASKSADGPTTEPVKS